MPACSEPSPECSASLRACSTEAAPRRRLLEAIRTRVHADRTCGWERRFDGWHGGDACSAATIGHTGFTGTGLWVDFDRGLAWTLLTNRVHPTRHRETGITELRRATGDAVIEASLR